MQRLHSSEYVLTCPLRFWTSSEIITSRKCKLYLDFVSSCGCQKQNCWSKLLIQETVAFCSVLKVISHCSSLNMRFMRQSFGITYFHLQSLPGSLLQSRELLPLRTPQSVQVTGKKLSRGFLFPYLLSCGLFCLSYFPPACVTLFQEFVWHNSDYVKKKSLLRISAWFIWRLLPEWPVSEGLYSHKSPSFPCFLVFVLFMFFPCLFIELTVTGAEKVLWVCVQSSAGLCMSHQGCSLLMQ